MLTKSWDTHRGVCAVPLRSCQLRDFQSRPCTRWGLGVLVREPAGGMRLEKVGPLLITQGRSPSAVSINPCAFFLHPPPSLLWTCAPGTLRAVTTEWQGFVVTPLGGDEPWASGQEMGVVRSLEFLLHFPYFKAKRRHHTNLMHRYFSTDL